jgi:hypothetical protein
MHMGGSDMHMGGFDTHMGGPHIHMGNEAIWDIPNRFTPSHMPTQIPICIWEGRSPIEL